MSDLDAERRFHALLEQALACEGEAREALLAALDADDPDLVAELRLCLEDDAQDDEIDTFLEHPAVKLAKNTMAPPTALQGPGTGAGPGRWHRAPAPEDWQVKIKTRRRIGPYKPLEVVGSGGIGKVYRAHLLPTRDTDDPAPPTPSVTVALKVLRGVLAEEADQQQLRRAMAKLRGLSHTHLATLLDGGVEDGGRAYYGAEWVEGPTITRYCAQQRASLRQRLELVLGICRGLEHAHGEGFLHLGLKPSNVLVATVDGAPCPKITDLGIVDALPDALSESAVLTRGGLYMAIYMCPEAIDSGRGTVDAQSDVYALGVLLFDLCLGVSPMESRGLSPVMMVRNILQGEVVTLGERWRGLDATTQETLAAERRMSVQEMEQVLQGQLQEVVRHAMAKAKGDRPSSVAALRQRLEALIDDFHRG